MRGLRFRLHLIVIFAVALGGFFAYRAHLSKETLLETHTRASESLEIRAIALSLIQDPTNPSTREQFVKINGFKRSVESESRRAVLADLTKVLSKAEPKLIRKRAGDVLDVETRMFNEYNRQAAEASQALELDMALALLTAGVSLVIFASVVRARVLRPIDRLSSRMKDFLIDRYSFQFAAPEAAELGDLHRTFNALAQRVINTMDELKTLDQAKSDFLNIASHELRTPLTSIKGSLSLLDSGVMGHLDPNCMRMIHIAEVETDRLIRLINDLLDLAKIESGHLPLACSWIPWDEMSGKVTESLLGLALKANVKIKVDTAAGLEIFMDRDRVQQVLTNLISNAIKFSPENSWVHVAIGRTKQDEVLINVRDQGPGISHEDSLNIFQKFRQGPVAENPLMKGTGLGLAIAKALVAEHHGDIGVESELGKGCVFWFTLPKWRDLESSSDDPQTEGTASSESSAA